MPTFVADPSTALYAILAVAVLVTGVIAAKRQKRSDLINFGIAAAALLALYLIDQAYESPRESIVGVLKGIETASQSKDYDAAFSHVSDDFKYQSLNKPDLRERARALQALSQVEGIKIVGVDRKGFAQKDESTAEQSFTVMPLGVPGNTYQYDCVGTFRKENGRWRLIAIVFKQQGQVVTPPGL
jgi:hypothetical protein